MIKTIHVCTSNVKGLRDKQKRLRFYEWIKCQKSNITFIQESHFDKNIEKLLSQEIKGTFYYSHGTSSSRGVAIIINEKLEYELIDEHTDEEGRILLLNIEVENIIYSLINIYAPNSESIRNSFYKKLNIFINKHAIGTVILGGDMNDALTNLDRNRTKDKNKIVKPVNSLKSLMKSNNLIDIWRHMNESKIQYTWRRLNPFQASRIDMFLINKDFTINIKSCDIRPILIKSTDHQAVSLKIESVISKTKGPGYWKLNNSVIEEKDYINKIDNLIKKYEILVNAKRLDPCILLDMLKLEIKNFSIQYCKNRARKSKNVTRKLENELKNLKLKYSGNESNIIADKIMEIEKEIERYYEYTAKGAQIRSRQEWVEKGERNNSYFLGLEKNNQRKKTILNLKDEKGNIVKDQREILQVEKRYYEKLYSVEEKNNNVKAYVSNTNVNYKLSKDESKSCDGYITLEELTNAVHNLKSN